MTGRRVEVDHSRLDVGALFRNHLGEAPQGCSGELSRRSGDQVARQDLRTTGCEKQTIGGGDIGIEDALHHGQCAGGAVPYVLSHFLCAGGSAVAVQRHQMHHAPERQFPRQSKQ